MDGTEGQCFFFFSFIFICFPLQFAVAFVFSSSFCFVYGSWLRRKKDCFRRDFIREKCIHLLFS